MDTLHFIIWNIFTSSLWLFKCLQMDKTSLQKRNAELDELLKNQFNGVSSSRSFNQPRMNYLLGSFDNNLSQRLARSQRLLSRIKDHHAQYHSSNDDKMDTFGNETTFMWAKIFEEGVYTTLLPILNLCYCWFENWMLIFFISL